jgi:diketogulonate reductase-like aldo/keto reductase
MLMSKPRMKTVALSSGERVPALGIGTWHFGENPSMRAEEIATLRMALDLGVTLVDTAEMYGEGLAEELIGEALSDRRRECFLVTKVYPHNASRDRAAAACERSLRRLQTEVIDLYLLHWRGSVPLEETVEAFVALQAAGKIRYWGVSNFDLADMQELWSVPGGSSAVTDQLLYNLSRRGIEWDLLPWLRQQRLPVMAYSPMEQSRLLQDARLANLAKQYEITPAQLALGWLLSKNDVIAIPKTSHRSRLRENLQALEIQLSPALLRELDRLFPPPHGPQPLAML